MAGVRITQEVPSGLPGQRYGSFVGKPAGPTHPVSRLTQLGPWGVSQELYGSFAGKPDASGEGGALYIPTYRPRRR